MMLLTHSLKNSLLLLLYQQFQIIIKTTNTLTSFIQINKYIH